MSNNQDESAAAPADGLLALANVILCSSVDGADRAYAEQIVQRVGVDLVSGADTRAARDAETIAQQFNRHMDVLLDGAADCAHFKERSNRRAAMARALDGAKLVLVDADYLAMMIDWRRVSTDLAVLAEEAGVSPRQALESQVAAAERVADFCGFRVSVDYYEADGEEDPARYNVND